MHSVYCRDLQQGRSTLELGPHASRVLAISTRTVYGEILSALRVSVLDSSFNPPTLAHLALAKSRPPYLQKAQQTTELLLLSVRNAEKSLMPGDATYVQRLEMMYLLSLDGRHGLLISADINDNVAIAIIDQPIFVGKSTILHSFLRSRLASLHLSLSAGTEAIHRPKLTFLMGFDTLVRLFSPKYYASEEEMTGLLQDFLSPEGQDCRIICARRVNVTIDEAFIDRDRIHFLNIGEDEQSFSSTDVRATVAAGMDNWRRQVTDHIADYIIENRLYASNAM
ncbi:Nucleotidylyl transferase [Pisolithus croceorrhizus]|nr:Nucleotidylyl transferase [Pisolithus croceorrhizus]